MTIDNTMEMITVPMPTRVSIGNDVWRAMAQQWYRHLDTINDWKVDTIQKSKLLPTQVVEQPLNSQLPKDKEYPGFRKFLRQRPYIIRHGTYFQPIEEPTWEFEKPLFPIITPEGKTGPYYLPDPPTPPMGPHQPIMMPFSYWRGRFGGILLLSEELMTYYEFCRHNYPWLSNPRGWEDYLVGVPYKDRFWWCDYGENSERSSYFNPISRPVWDYEFAFVGNGWTPSGQRE
ncbi:hypothetical protein PTTW11_07031 [Pyrenophora teres f. teres]|uniref:Uncharacterized protein n=1 Tax=Pyrenophora teres f. teres TaxID=97479 RepID=A0A6S6W6E1_9PLEO|nr:hypothetical protein PTNB29_08336 [Pyrenophora teres f. teres]CAE7186820.1 hypothetical protein PTTW11_07031 [Pyrenophora teres f. teres]